MLRNNHSISQNYNPSFTIGIKVFGVIYPYQPHRTPRLQFHIFFICVEPPSPTGKDLHPLHSLQVKTRQTCLGRFWNPTTKWPEGQLHSSPAMLRFDHFRRPNHRGFFQQLASTHHSNFMMPVWGLLQSHWVKKKRHL